MLEIAVAGECFCDASILHYNETRTIHEAPGLVGVSSIAIDCSSHQCLIHNDDVNDWTLPKLSYGVCEAISGARPGKAVACFGNDPIGQYNSEAAFAEIEPDFVGSFVQILSRIQ
ncbi:MAG TPA: hypothetical protein VJ828_13055 [Lacipirellulaceae bacterium]|nr:hypothetical protein [Lacipirellulaceae bacterium]